MLKIADESVDSLPSICSEFQEAVNSLNISSLVNKLSGFHITSLNNSQDIISTYNPIISRLAGGLSAGYTCVDLASTSLGSQAIAGTHTRGLTTLLFINLGPWFGEPKEFMI